MKVTVKEAAQVMNCSEQFVRIGLQRNILNIGNAVKMSSRWTYNIVPEKLAERQGITLAELERRINNEQFI